MKQLLGGYSVHGVVRIAYAFTTLCCPDACHSPTCLSAGSRAYLHLLSIVCLDKLTVCVRRRVHSAITYSAGLFIPPLCAPAFPSPHSFSIPAPDPFNWVCACLGVPRVRVPNVTLMPPYRRHLPPITATCSRHRLTRNAPIHAIVTLRLLHHIVITNSTLPH